MRHEERRAEGPLRFSVSHAPAKGLIDTKKGQRAAGDTSSCGTKKGWDALA